MKGTDREGSNPGDFAMKIGMLRLGLSLMIVLGFWTNRLPAQDHLLVVPTIPYEPLMHPPTPAPFGPRSPGLTATNPLHRTLNNHGMACGIDPYYVPCG